MKTPWREKSAPWTVHWPSAGSRPRYGSKTDEETPPPNALTASLRCVCAFVILPESQLLASARTRTPATCPRQPRSRAQRPHSVSPEHEERLVAGRPRGCAGRVMVGESVHQRVTPGASGRGDRAGHERTRRGDGGWDSFGHLGVDARADRRLRTAFANAVREMSFEQFQATDCQGLGDPRERSG